MHLRIKEERVSHSFKVQTSTLIMDQWDQLLYALMPTPSVDKMAATNVPQEALPCIILAKMENAETVEVVGVAKCSFTQQQEHVQPADILARP